MEVDEAPDPMSTSLGPKEGWPGIIGLWGKPRRGSPLASCTKVNLVPLKCYAGRRQVGWLFSPKKPMSRTPASQGDMGAC